MGKKKGGKSVGKVSMGIGSNVASNTLNSIKADRPAWVRTVNQMRAHREGKKVMVTVANPNKEQRNKLFIRVPASTVWRDPKVSNFVML
jgi:hypothetical protein